MPKFSLSLSWHDQPCPFLALLAQGQLSRHHSKKETKFSIQNMKLPAMEWSWIRQAANNLHYFQENTVTPWQHTRNWKQNTVNISWGSSCLIYKDVLIAPNNLEAEVKRGDHAYNYHMTKTAKWEDNTTKWWMQHLIWLLSNVTKLCLQLKIS